MEDDDSDNEGQDDPELEREVIAEKLFVGGSDEVCHFYVSVKHTKKWCLTTYRFVFSSLKKNIY